MVTLDCPECGDSFDSRGLQPHLRSTHDLTPPEARAKFRTAKMAAGLEPTAAEEADSGPAPEPTPGVPDAGASETPAHLQGDPELTRLEKDVLKARKEAELMRIREFMKQDGSSDDDFLEKLAKLKEAGLLGEDSDGGSNMDSMMVRKLGQLERKLENGDSGGGPEVSVSSETAGPLETALAASGGDLDAEVIAALAEASHSPEAKKAEYDFKKAEMRMQRRQELVNDVLDQLGNADVLGSVIEAVTQARQQRQQPPAQQTRERPPESRQEPREPTPTTSQGNPRSVTFAKEGADESVEEPEPEPTESPARQKLREIERAEAAVTDGGDGGGSRTGEFRGPAGPADDEGGEDA